VSGHLCRVAEGLSNRILTHTPSPPRQAVPGLATHAEEPKEAKKLFSYLAAESYTPQVSGAGCTQ
jgi:hypothetical protein